MELKVFKSLWGFGPITEFTLAAVAAKGYGGIEFKSVSIFDDSSFREWLYKYHFDFIAQIHTEGNSVEENLISFESLIQRALSFKPILINSQSGRDFWSYSQKCRFLEKALRIEEKYAVPVAHETHRSRISFTPWDTSALVETFPSLKICADFSHWVNVCERLLTTESSQLEKVIPACLHIHARVGYEQGPQVPDPQAPEYSTQVSAHEKWWQQIWQNQNDRGMPVSTVCPEYGPVPYQHSVPFTNKPVSDIHEISDWAMGSLKSLFKFSSHDK